MPDQSDTKAKFPAVDGPARPSFLRRAPQPRPLGAAASHSPAERLLAEVLYLERAVAERRQRVLEPKAAPAPAYRMFNL